MSSDLPKLADRIQAPELDHHLLPGLKNIWVFSKIASICPLKIPGM